MARESERKKIRKRVEKLLKDAKIPKVGQDVFSQRSVPTEHESLPVILLYPRNESIERNDHSPKTYQRTLNLEIEIQTTHDTDDLLADELDELAQAVEDVMEESNDLEGLGCVNQLDLISTLYDTEGEGFSPIGSVRLTYAIEYFTEEGLADKDLVPFKKAKTDWHLEDETDEKDAEDVIEFTQE